MAIAATLGVVMLDVLEGVRIALGLSVFVALGKLTRPHDAVLGEGAGRYCPAIRHEAGECPHS